MLVDTIDAVSYRSIEHLGRCYADADADVMRSRPLHDIHDNLSFGAMAHNLLISIMYPVKAVLAIDDGLDLPLFQPSC